VAAREPDDDLSVTEPRTPPPPTELLLSTPDAIPRLPVLGWQSFVGRAPLPDDSLLAAPNFAFTTSGRAAIWLALRALGVGTGDRVLVPTYHCPTMVAPAIHAGAEPAFYPVTSAGVDMQYLAKLDCRGVKALLVAHFFGRPAPMAQLREFCDANGIALIEDCAHALFGMTDGKPVGAWGDFAIGSFTKFLPVPEAGCLASWRRSVTPGLARQTLRAELKCSVDLLEVGARYGRLPGLNTVLLKLFALKNAIRHPPGAETAPAPADYTDGHGDLDTDYASSSPTRVTRLVAKATGWRRVRERRRANYAALVRALDGVPGLRVLYPELTESGVPYVLPVWVTDPDAKYLALRGAGCPVFRWDWLWPGTPLVSGDEGIAWSRHVFQLPCHQDLTAQDTEWLIATVRRVLSSSSAVRVAVSTVPRRDGERATAAHQEARSVDAP